MTQPPGPPGGRPDDEPPRPGFEPPYVPPPDAWPPMGPPGGYPYGPPPESRMKPPWRSAAPGEKGKYVGFAILGFAVPWLALAASVLVFFISDSDPNGAFADVAPGLAFFLIVLAGALDLTGLILAFAVPNRTVRSLGWGAFIALLTHVTAVAIGILVLFGWCISYLNSDTV